MKKWILLLGLTLTSYTLLARPYLSRYKGVEFDIVFEGPIKDEDEPKVVRLQSQYLESFRIHPNRLHNYEIELKKMGVTVTKIDRDPLKSGATTPYYPPPSIPIPTPETPSSTPTPIPEPSVQPTLSSGRQMGTPHISAPHMRTPHITAPHITAPHTGGHKGKK